MSFEDHKLRGIYSAVPTPFTKSGEVDIDGLLELMAWQLDPTSLQTQPDQYLGVQKGVSGFVIYGTTGESPTLTPVEREQITRAAVERFPNIEMIAGVGSNDTARTVELAIQARAWGATGGLVVTPYYNKPSQSGLYRHFAMIAEATPDWPLVLYVVPSRAVITLEVETITHLLNAYPNIIAIKDATADLAYTAELISCCKDRAQVLSGDDPTALAAWALGAQGSISVASNLIPEDFTSVWQRYSRGDHEEARRLFLEIHPLIRALFIESNPTPLKAALASLSAEGLIPVSDLTPEVRAPLALLSDCSMMTVMNTLKTYLETRE